MEWYRDKRTTNGVRRVVIRLDVGVLHGLVQAGDDGLNLERRVVCKCVGEDITGGNVDTLLEEVVLEAIRQGFEIFGLSEHAPRYRECDLYPEEVCDHTHGFVVILLT